MCQICRNAGWTGSVRKLEFNGTSPSQPETNLDNDWRYFSAPLPSSPQAQAQVRQSAPKLDAAEVDQRFWLIEPTEDQLFDLRNIREEFQASAKVLAGLLPEGRAKALAITKLEEALMWASRAIVEGDKS